MTSHTTDKKRKRSNSNESGGVSFSVPITSASLDIVGESSKDTPLVVGSFGSVKVPEDLKFEAFREKNVGQSSEKILLHGENKNMEYEGITSVLVSPKKKTHKRLTDTSNSTEAKPQYMVALYDSVKKSVELYRAPFFDFNPIVKAKRQYTGSAIKSASGDITNVEMRTKLGHTFGTRKAQKLLRSRELNQIDSTVLSDIRDEIVDSVSTATDSLPSQQQVKETKEKERLIPVFNEEATNPSEIYPIENIIPPKEWQRILVDNIFNESDPESRIAKFPFQSQYIKSRITRNGELDASNTSDVNYIKLLYYLSFLIGLFQNRRSKKKHPLAEKLNHPPEILVTGALERFTNSFNPKSKDGRFVMDVGSELKLFAYIAALALRIDNYILEIVPLANELNLKPSKLSEILYAMGCNIKAANAAQSKELNLNKNEAVTYKIATLTVPFKAPELVKRSRGGPSRR